MAQTCPHLKIADKYRSSIVVRSDGNDKDKNMETEVL